MDRRNFLKLFSATAATASASKILANIPEAEPKIQLLEEKSIISLDNDLITFTDNVIAYEYSSRDNGYYSAASINNYVRSKWIKGLIDGQIKVEIYLNNVINKLDFYFTFNIPSSFKQNHIINNKKFLCTNIKVDCNAYNQLRTATIIGTEFYA